MPDNVKMSDSYLNNHLLIAMPQMHDPNFEKTVTLICEHNQEGALGLVLNRPMDISVGEILEQLDLDYCGANSHDPILIGGPVATDRGFVLHELEKTSDKIQQTWDSSLSVSEDIKVTTSKDILEAIAAGNGPQKLEFALGYSGWEAGQLEEEISLNTWLTVPCDKRIIFDVPYSNRWEAAAQLIGIDIKRISNDIGHA